MNLPALYLEDFSKVDFSKVEKEKTELELECSWVDSVRTRLRKRDGVAQCRELISLVSDQHENAGAVSQAVIGALYKKAGLGILSEMLAGAT